MAKTEQIRIYDVRPDRLDEWVDKFNTLIVPLRRRVGFEIQGSWVDRERSQHIWVIAHDGDFEKANDAYWASSKREELDVNPDEFLTSEDTRTVSSTSR